MMSPESRLAPIMERLGLNQSNWVQTVRGFGRLFKQAAGRSDSLVDAAAPARGAGSRARRRLAPPLYRPPLDIEPSKDISIRLPLEESDRLARSTHCPVPSRQGEPCNLVTSSDHAHTTVVLRRRGPRPPRVAESGSPAPLLRPSNLWVSLRQESSRKEEETRTRKPFIATLRVNESRPAELGQQPEASLAWGGVTLTAKRRQRVPMPCDRAPKYFLAGASVVDTSGGRADTPQWPGVFGPTGVQEQGVGTRGSLGNLRDPAVSI